MQNEIAFSLVTPNKKTLFHHRKTNQKQSKNSDATFERLFSVIFVFQSFFFSLSFRAQKNKRKISPVKHSGSFLDDFFDTLTSCLAIMITVFNENFRPQLVNKSSNDGPKSSRTIAL